MSAYESVHCIAKTIATTISKAIVVTVRNNVAKKKLQSCDALRIIAVNCPRVTLDSADNNKEQRLLGDGEQNIVI